MNTESDIHALKRRRSDQRATIRDVAAKAGVSVTTVSHFVSGKVGACSAETAERLRSVIAELRYVPNAPAQDLGQRMTRTVGVCMLHPLDYVGETVGSFPEKTWRGVIKAADRHNYLLLHYPHSMRYGNRVDEFVNGRVDGIIMAPSAEDPRPRLITEFRIPIVVIIQNSNIPAGIGAVFADEGEAVDLALSHLWDLGHRKIAHMTGPIEPVHTPEVSVGNSEGIAVWRRDAYVTWMSERDCFHPDRIVPGYSWDGAYIEAAVQRLFQMRDRPTAILCANDALSMKTIEAAAALGWKVPQELSVVGIDNLTAGATLSPSLTTVDVPAIRIGEKAMDLLLDLIAGNPVETLKITVRGSVLITRESTGPCPHSL